MPKYWIWLKNLSGSMSSITFSLFLLTLCQESCEEKRSCTAVNWKYEGNHECILRACSLPVLPPKNSLPKWKAFYITTPTTSTYTTTTATTITRTTTTFLGDRSNFDHNISFPSEWISTTNVFSNTECPNIGSGAKGSVEACQVLLFICFLVHAKSLLVPLKNSMFVLILGVLQAERRLHSCQLEV